MTIAPGLLALFTIEGVHVHDREGRRSELAPGSPSIMLDRLAHVAPIFLDPLRGIQGSCRYALSISHLFSRRTTLLTYLASAYDPIV